MDKMALNNWRKVENEAGYPCYIDETIGKQQFDHPEFQKIVASLEEYNNIKYSVYRIAFKAYALQRQIKVPPIRISSGVFARHQLSLSESSLSLDTAELEAVLGDIYFAAEKEGLFTGDVDLAVDLLINLLLNVYDRDRKEPLRLLAAKTLLIILSEESVGDKWLALANCCADHNGCVSPKRLAGLLMHITALVQFFGDTCDQLQHDVDACFAKSAGMLGAGAGAVAEWGVSRCSGAGWLVVLQRVAASRSAADVSALCAACNQPLIQVLKFKCTKCMNVFFCEKCYLYEKDLTTNTSCHKKAHVVHEIIDGEMKPPECISFIKGMKRFFFCTKTKKKKTCKKQGKSSERAESNGTARRKGKPAIFTSTVGKASGNNANNPTTMLQDIIVQLEAQNKALRELSGHIQSGSNNEVDRGLKEKVDTHWTQISNQITRLKILKENLSIHPPSAPSETSAEKPDRPQAFDLFSPIVNEPQTKVTDTMKNKPRVLSLDSGNFSVVSKQTDSQLMTMSGDALKPVVIHATSDSISTVSMNDISSWYNENESSGLDKRKASSAAESEDKFQSDMRCVETTNHKMKELNADLDTVLDRLQQILTNNFAMDESCFDNSQLRETATEMEGLLGTLIRGVETRTTLQHTQRLV